VQVVIALVVTTDGFPLAYEVMNGSTIDSTTLSGFLDKIENTYGKAKRMWVMDRGIPTEAVLAAMRAPGREGGELYVLAKERGSPGQRDCDAAQEAGPATGEAAGDAQEPAVAGSIAYAVWVRSGQRRGGPMGLSKYVCLKLARR